MDLLNRYIRQGGKGDPWTVLDGLVGKGMVESDCRKIEKEYMSGNSLIKSYHHEWWYRLTEAGNAHKVGSTKEPVRNTGPINSKDPRKKVIVAEMKRRSGGTKVTGVKETATHFEGSPMCRAKGKYETYWHRLPNIKILKTDFKFKVVK